MEEEKVRRYLRSQMDEPFVKDVAKKFYSWIRREESSRIGPVGKFFVEILERAERGEFRSEKEKDDMRKYYEGGGE